MNRNLDLHRMNIDFNKLRSSHLAVKPEMRTILAGGPFPESKDKPLALENEALKSRPWAQLTLTVIGQMRELYDGLAALHAVDNPAETAEMRAEKFAGSVTRYSDKAVAAAKKQFNDLVELRIKTEDEAIAKAGLNWKTDYARDIQQALREMTPKERNKAIVDAFDNNDRDIIQSIYKVPAIVRGQTTVAIDVMTQRYIEQFSPELPATLEAMDTAMTYLDNAGGGFKRSAEALRDLEAEHRAAEGKKAANLAEARLAVAAQQMQTE